jgi:hypothetical protein
MDNLLHITAVMLITIWAICFFVLDAGIVIHILLVIAVVSMFLAIVKRKRKLE